MSLRSPLPARSLPRALARLPIVLLVAALALPAFAAAKPEPPKVDLKYEKYTLPNGLEVILSVDRRVPVAAVNIWYHVGPANEEPGRTGFAHLFEHMMFQASAHIPEDMYFKYLQGAGASEVNGSTDYDRTNYLEDMPANELELALWAESDRMGFLLDRLDASTLGRQQEVVRNERRQSVENQPYGLAEDAVYQLTFPQGHPYYANIIGSHADLQAAKLEDVRDFFQRYYCPNNATLCVVGDIDIARTKQWIERYFGSIPRGQPVPPITATTPPITSERRQVVTDKVELPRIHLTWLTAPIYTPGDEVALLAAQILAGGKAARLDSALVYDRKLAQSVSCTQTSLTLGSVFTVKATAKPGHTAEEMEAAIDAELARLAAAGPSEAELTRARNTIWSQKLSALEQPGSFEGVADQLNQYNHHLKNPGWLNQDLARFAGISREDVRRFARETLARNRRTVVTCLPGEKTIPPEPPQVAPPPPPGEQVADREPWRAQRPAGQPESAFTLPVPKSFRLANGLQVFLMETHYLPLFSARIAVRSGSGDDPFGREGLASLTANLLDEGTSRRDALGLVRELETLGAQITATASADGSQIGVAGLVHNADPLGGILADIVRNPSFAPADVERVRNDVLTTLLQQRDSITATANRLTAPCLYGAQHPYGHQTIGYDPSLRAISRNDILAFHRQHYSPANGALILAGDLTEAQARRFAEKVFGDWRGEPAPDRRPAVAQPIAEPIVVVDKPGSTQTAVYMEQECARRADPDFDALEVFGQVLGGSSGRLFMNLREDKGWTYGAYAQLAWRRSVGPLRMMSRVQADASAGAIVEFRRELASLLNTEAGSEELERGKVALVRTLPANFTTTNQLASTVLALYLYDQPQDYFRSFARRVMALTGADVLAAGQRHLNLEKCRTVLVGDAGKILPQLVEKQLGPVARLTPDGERLTEGTGGR